MKAELIPYLLSGKYEILDKVAKEVAHGSHTDPARIFVNFEAKYIQVQLKELFLRLKKKYKVTAAWVHVMTPGASHTSHTHSTAIGVIYLKVPDISGNLLLEAQHVTITPRRDHFVFVPAGEPHSITENKSKSSRIALAFQLEELK